MFSFHLSFVSLRFAGKLNGKVETKLINEFHRIYLQENVKTRASVYQKFKEHDPDIDVIKDA